MDGFMLLALRNHGTYREPELAGVVIDAIGAAMGPDKARRVRNSKEFGSFVVSSTHEWLIHAEASLLVQHRELVSSPEAAGPAFGLTEKGTTRLAEIERNWTPIRLAQPSATTVAGYLPRFVNWSWPSLVAGGVLLSGVPVAVAIKTLRESLLTWAVLALLLVLAVGAASLRWREVRATRRMNPWYWLAREDVGRFVAAGVADSERRLLALSGRMQAAGRDVEALLQEVEATLDEVQGHLDELHDDRRGEVKPDR